MRLRLGMVRALRAVNSDGDHSLKRGIAGWARGCLGGDPPCLLRFRGVRLPGHVSRKP
ncbi:unannotated protein [freshwater metagenome]|uniref:Unannotated protein n=1 Tax=freshwater metagenome TaxID=449393 RepID=A0A6J7SQE5_9ZZZZ